MTPLLNLISLLEQLTELREMLMVIHVLQMIQMNSQMEEMNRVRYVERSAKFPCLFLVHNPPGTSMYFATRKLLKPYPFRFLWRLNCIGINSTFSLTSPRRWGGTESFSHIVGSSGNKCPPVKPPFSVPTTPSSTIIMRLSINPSYHSSH